MLKPFTQAFIDDVAWDQEAPLHISVDAVGLLNPVDNCARSSENWMATPCKAQVRANCHFWHWKTVEERVPPAYQDQGLFWWTAQQWTWLLRPNLEMIAKVEQVKASFEWEAHRPILGIHVRHGDSCMGSEGGRTGRKCEDLEVYMKGAEQMEQYGFKSIFLATDDLTVAHAAREKYPQFYWLIGNPTASQNRNTDGGWNHRFEQMAFESGEKNMDLQTEFREVLLDIHLLADTDGFVGKFTSNVDRIAYALNYGQRGCAVPFISLDAYWCNDYGLEKGKTVQGAKFAC